MYRWLKDGMPVTDFSTGQYYRIPNTRRDDAGSYQCMARNDAGTIFSEKIDVIVACKYYQSKWNGKVNKIVVGTLKNAASFSKTNKNGQENMLL